MASSAATLEHRPGDLWAFSGNLRTSRAIKFFTCSPYSHVGGIAVVDRELLGRLMFRTDLHFPPPAEVWRNWTARPLLFESTTLSEIPCSLMGRTFSGVQAHEPEAVLENYPGRVWRIRLRNGWALGHEASERLSHRMVRQVGLPYDRHQAMLSGTLLLKRWLWSPSDLHYVFCSELWAHALMELGRFPLQNTSKVNPGRLVNWLVDAGIYTQPEVLK